MQLSFWGAAQTVTGSMHLLEVNGQQILLDCGLYQGKRSLSYERNLNFPFDPASIDVVILSHAHIDHSGNLPNLIKQGFRGSVWSTPATCATYARPCCKTAVTSRSRTQHTSIRSTHREGLPPVAPLYTKHDAVEAIKQFVSINYSRPFSPVSGVTATFLDAGHILGSALVVLDIAEGDTVRRLVFSGDLGRQDMAILRNPEVVNNADFLIMESTYGNRRHETRDEARQVLRRTIVETHKRRGKVIIPSFAVGRTQELVYALHQLSEAQKIPSLDIYVDSPLAVDVTEIFRAHPECYDEETLELMQQARSPFGFKRLSYVREAEELEASELLARTRR